MAFVLRQYFSWHYRFALKGIFRVCRNYFFFIIHYFSIFLLARTLFLPWKKDITGYGRGFDLAKIFQVLMWNMIARVIGAIIRGTTIFIGLIFLAIETMLSIVILCFWIFWPAIFLLGIFIIIGIVEIPLLL